MAEVNLKRLGDAIRTFREQAQPRKISQFQLAVLMEWQGTAPIVEIEQGRRLPRPETLNALGEALQLNPADIAYLHGLAGYRATTVMPPIEQVKRVLYAIEPTIVDRLFPVYILDYQFRFWMMNPAAVAFQGGSLDLVNSMMVHGVDAFTMVFDSRLPIQAGLSMSERIKRESIFRFKAYNLYRRYEPFYLAYPECMKERLLSYDYQHFVQLWHEIDMRMQDIFPATPQVSIESGGVVLKFEIHMVELLHLDRLFFAGYYAPIDDGKDNRAGCEAYFAQHSLGKKACIHVWDFHSQGPPG